MNEFYTQGVIASLELGWGEGWLSPGGDAELELLLDGIDVRGKTILDIGVGSGGPALSLLNNFGAAHVTGIDVEQPVIDRALELARAQQLDSQLDLHCIKPGLLPFTDEKFDVVFSKDCFVHIADKKNLFDEVYRILTPNGIFVFSDWCCSMPPYSVEMKQFLENGMNFSMATAGNNVDNMIQAGFVDIKVWDRNEWFAEYAIQENREVAGLKRKQIVGLFGEEKAGNIAAATKRRATIGRQGHLRPTHFSSSKNGVALQ